jgi:hypothetical protein
MYYYTMIVIYYYLYLHWYIHVIFLCRHLLESLQHLLPSSLQKITNHIHQTFLCVHEASQTSPSWTAYLRQIDSALLAGLKHLLLTVLATLVQKATRYEQGAPISPLVMVQIELQGGDIQFSPPLSGHSAINSVPEVVQKWMNDYLSLTKMIPRCVHYMYMHMYMYMYMCMCYIALVQLLHANNTCICKCINKQCFNTFAGITCRFAWAGNGMVAP